MKKFFLTGDVLHFGDRSSNGRVYSKDTLQDAVSRFKQKVAEGRIGAVGGLDSDRLDTPMKLGDVSHKVSDINITDNSLSVELEILDTPCGRMIKNLVLAGLPCYAAIRGLGNVDKDGIVRNYDLLYVDVNAESSFNNIEPLKLRTEYGVES